VYAISADYPAAVRHSFERAIGRPFIPANGCCGDVGPVWRGGDARLRVGGTISREAASARHRVLQLESNPALGVLSRMAQIPVPPGSHHCRAHH
jgi:hypothetical protein